MKTNYCAIIARIFERHYKPGMRSFEFKRAEIECAATEQDVAFCAQQYPLLVCRPVAVQFLPDKAVAMFELTMDDDEVQIVRESHYRLVPAKDIGATELVKYRTRRS